MSKEYRTEQERVDDAIAEGGELYMAGYRHGKSVQSADLSSILGEFEELAGK